MRRRMSIGAVLAALVWAMPLSLAEAQTGAATPSYGCQVPTTPPAPGADAAAFAVYSWQMFIALNWTPTPGQRGVPDCSQPIGSTPSTVWQSYKQVDQTSCPTGATQARGIPPRPRCC